MIGPNAGPLACGMEGQGRMSEPGEICEVIEQNLYTGKPFFGKRVLILSGPTQEPLDPVRYVSNHSSGKMGKALADTATLQGAEVTFITGPVPETNLPSGRNLETLHVHTAEQMLHVAEKIFQTG